MPLIYTACRTCYSELEPDDIFRRASPARSTRPSCRSSSRRDRIGPRLDDRAHRLHVRDQRRLADAVAPARPPPGRRRVRPAEPALRHLQGRLDDAPVDPGRRRSDLRRRYEEQIEGSLALYGDLVAAGIPGEDARFVFPNATRTNLVMTANLRALIHMTGLRLCTMAQWEIRRLFQLIRHEIFPSRRSSALPRPQVRPARLLRRDGQPRRALPDPAAQGQRPRAWAEKAKAAREAGGSCAVRDQPRAGLEPRRGRGRTNRRSTGPPGPASAPAARTPSWYRGSPLTLPRRS